MGTAVDGTKKQIIINKAIDLFAKHGISNVSLVMLADSLGASTGMIYHHFPAGKEEIIMEILRVFEDVVSDSIPDKKAWESKDADVNDILFSLFFAFPSEDMMRMRKITRIIMAEMYHNEQIAGHAATHLITGREKMLAECFTTLAGNGKIPPLDAESAARCLNRLIVVYGIEDALRYPFEQDNTELDAQTERMTCDCTNIIQYMITKSADLTLNTK